MEDGVADADLFSLKAIKVGDDKHMSAKQWISLVILIKQFFDFL